MARQLFGCIVAVVGVVACTGKGNTPPQYHAIDTTGTIALKGQQIAELTTSGVRELISFQEHLLLYANIDGKLLHLISKEQGGIVASFGHQGRSDNEFIQIGNLQKIDQNSFLAYDNSTHKIAIYNIDSILLGQTNPRSIKRINIPKEFASGSVNQLYVLENGASVYSGGTGITNKGASMRFALTGKDDSVVDCFYGYPYAQDTMRMKIAYNTLPPLVAVVSDLHKMAVANTPIGAILEIFDLKNDKIELLDIRYIIEPLFEYQNNTMADPSNSVVGFTDIGASKSNICALYIGSVVTGMPKSKVVLFDWNGKTTGVYAIDSFGNQIVYDELRHAFYVVELQESGHIVLMKYAL